MSKLVVSVGCDPEVFVKKDGFFHSAWGLIKGDKANPQPVRRGAVQVDGMALEFNIDPAFTEDEFCINVQDVLNQMKLMVPKFEVVAVPVAHFTEEHMKQQPAEALELGCTPDYNSWTCLVNEKPNGNRPMRTASGHVHIGWTKGKDVEQDFDHMNTAANVGKQMDFFLGLGSLFYDADQERREMYGKAGCIRIKPYGVEYRTLSNAWLNTEERMRWVFRNTKRGVEEFFRGNILADKYGDIQEIVNSSNLKEAAKILKKEKIEVCYA